MAREALSGQVELSVSEFRVLFVESHEELVEVVGHLVFVNAVVEVMIRETESGS